MKRMIMPLAVAGLILAGCEPTGKRVDALCSSSWSKSKWISAADAKKVDAATWSSERATDGVSWFVGKVKIEREIRSAKWMTAGLGVYELYVNGVRVGSDALKPGFTHGRKTKRSFTYDITPMLDVGEENYLAAEVSAGWWCDLICGYIGKVPAFRSVLEIEYTDGTKELSGTDRENWRAGVAGPITHAAIYDGEEYDARIEPPYFGSPTLSLPVYNNEFNGEILPTAGAEVCRRFDLAIKPVEIYVWQGVEGGRPEEEIFGKVVKTREYPADSDEIVLLPDETLIVDFGQNAAAVPSFAFTADEGTVVTVLPVEMLNDMNGERSRGNDGPGGSAYRENLRAPATGMKAVYTFGRDADNGSPAVYFPTHTFFGYRYLSITASDKVVFRMIASIPVTSITKEMEIGSIVTGVKDVNRLISNIYWGQLSNYLSVPTDCPQRNERLGWTADAQVFCEAGSFNADTSRFFEKWMRDMVDNRDDDGGFASVAPLAQYGNETFNFGWADAGVIVPWTIWKQFGDTKIIADNFDAMAGFVRRIDETRYKYEDKHYYTYADWLSFEKFETCGNEFGDWQKWRTDPDARNYREFLAACYWLYDSRLMVQMANAIGRKAEADEFADCARRAMDYIHATYIEDDGLLLKPMRSLQTACIFALKFGIVEGRAFDETRELLLKSIREHGDRLQTGVLGTGFIMDTLTQIGASDVAYTLLLQRKNPSWLYSVDQGATTIWERWNSYVKDTGFGPVGMNSFNHYAYGAVLAWMYKTMAGIAADPTNPGFRHIVMAPKPDRRIGFVKAEYRSPAGLIKSAWDYSGDVWTWRFTIPEGASATVTVPGKEPAEYTAGSYTVSITLLTAVR